MIEKVFFSIIIPVYNVEKYLKKCVESVINQTYKNIEIILIDDGSKDLSYEICDEYKNKDNRVKVIHKENGGLSDARNCGIEIAEGEYIVFLDSDDYIETDTAYNFYKYVEDTYFDILVGKAKIIGNSFGINQASFNKGEIFSGEEYLKNCFIRNKICMSACFNVYRREFLTINKLKFKKGILHEDEQFTPRAFLKAKKVVYTGIEFYNYIIRNNSITKTKDYSRNISDFYSTCEELSVIYSNVKDKELKKLLLDSLVEKYLSLFFAGNGYNLSKKLVHKKFVIKNSKKLYTKIKAVLFTVSPRFYCKINSITKNRK